MPERGKETLAHPKGKSFSFTTTASKHTGGCLHSRLESFQNVEKNIELYFIL